MDARDFLQELVETRSLSGEEGAVAELLVTRMAESGLDAHVDGAGNAVGVKRGAPAPEGEEERSVVLLGHIDTVPGEVPVRVEDGKLYGRGSVDAKGPIATFVRAVAEVEPAPGVTLIVIGAVEEECASSKGARFVAPLYSPEVCIIGEPSGWDALTLGYKGRFVATVEFEQGCGHSAGPEGAVSETAADLWQGVRAWCEEFNADKQRLFDACLPSLADFVTSSDGLHDQVLVRMSFRIPPDFDAVPLRTRIEELAGEATVTYVGEELAWTSPRTSPLARAFSRAFAAQDVRPRFKHKTGTSDMNVLGPVWKCPIAAYGPGDSTLDHTPNEHIVLAEYERAIEVLKDALRNGGWAE